MGLPRSPCEQNSAYAMLDSARTPARVARRPALCRLAPPLLLALVCLPALFVGLGAYPAAWFDEGFKMNSARLLAETGIFGSRGAAGPLPFDMGVTSGPLEVGAMALSYRLFGLGLAPGRAAIALFALLQVLLIALLARDIAGRGAGLTAGLFAVALPPIGGVSLLLIGRQALAEAPAAAMVLLGLWLLLRSWREGRAAGAVFAGLACGVGLLSKSQFALALIPALALVGAARWLRREEGLARAAAPTLAALAVFFGWSLIGRLATGPELQRYNSEMLRLGIGTNLLTDQLGRGLSPSALLLGALCLAGAGYGAWRARRLWGPGGPGPAGWMLLTLAALAALNTLWFALLSVGWPRYSYLGLVAALALLGLAAHQLLSLGRIAPGPGRAPAAALAALAALAWAGHLPPALAAPAPGHAEQMARHIERELPRDALVESWEWELDALGAHSRYHHPHQRYVYQAIARQGRPGGLAYDHLQAAPDYLLAGPFSDYTGIYPSELSPDFALEIQIGPYRLYRRLP